MLLYYMCHWINITLISVFIKICATAFFFIIFGYNANIKNNIDCPFILFDWKCHLTPSMLQNLLKKRVNFEKNDLYVCTCTCIWMNNCTLISRVNTLGINTGSFTDKNIWYVYVFIKNYIWQRAWYLFFTLIKCNIFFHVTSDLISCCLHTPPTRGRILNLLRPLG